MVEAGSAAKQMSERRPDERQQRWSGVGVAAAGILVTLPLYVVIYHQQSQGRSPAAIAMPDMGMTDMAKYWSFPLLQSSGLAGLAFAWASVLLGLQQSGRRARWMRLSYHKIDRLHRQISLLVISLVVVHVSATVFDAMGDSWRTVLLFNQWSGQGWPQADWGYDAGIIAMYVLALVAPTFYIRRRIGVSRWRVLHRFVLVFYGLSVWHALVLGLDVAHYAWLRPLIWLAQIPLLAMLIRRVLRPARATQTRPTGPLARLARTSLLGVGAASIAAVLTIVISGHSGFIATV